MAIAKIENSVVTQVDRTINTAPNGWVECDDAVIVGMLYNNGVFTVPPPPVLPPEVPREVEPRKFRRALRVAGLHDAVMAYIATRPPEEQDDFEYAVSILRTNPTIIAGATALGKTEAEIDAVFILASQQP